MFSVELLILVLALVVAVATVIPLSRSTRWWVRSLDFPRLQLLFLSLVALCMTSVFAESAYGAAAIALSAGCILYQSYWIYPYSPLAMKEVASAGSKIGSASISILTANVLMTNRNTQKFLELVSTNDPDLVLMLESDSWWEDQVRSLESSYPYRVSCPLSNLYGMHLYSKFPLGKSEVKYLVEDDIPSMHAELQLSDTIKVRAHFLHPQPPVPEYNSSSGERDAELIVVAKSLQGFKGPAIVAGDLNDVAWSETTRLFRSISGLLDPRVGRGMFNTFNAKYWFMRWPLDHLFHSHHFRVRDIRRLEDFGSDHFAFYTELIFADSTPSPDAQSCTSDADEEFASEILDQHEVETEDVPLDDREK